MTITSSNSIMNAFLSHGIFPGFLLTVTKEYKNIADDPDIDKERKQECIKNAKISLSLIAIGILVSTAIAVEEYKDKHSIPTIIATELASTALCTLAWNVLFRVIKSQMRD